MDLPKPPVSMERQLSQEEARILQRAEEKIASGLQSFIDVGHALCVIRDSKLYRVEHESFASYLRNRWGFERAHGYRLIESSKFIQELKHYEGLDGISLPANERNVRLLKGIGDMGKCRAVLLKAKEIADADRIEHRHIVKAIQELQLSGRRNLSPNARKRRPENSSDGAQVARIVETVIECLECRTNCSRELALMRQLRTLISGSHNGAESSCVTRSEGLIEIKGANTNHVVEIRS